MGNCMLSLMTYHLHMLSNCAEDSVLVIFLYIQLDIIDVTERVHAHDLCQLQGRNSVLQANFFNAV